MEKQDCFHTPITRFAPDPDVSLRSFIEALGRIGGRPRRISTAIDLWNKMLERNRVVLCARSTHRELLELLRHVGGLGGYCVKVRRISIYLPIDAPPPRPA